MGNYTNTLMKLKDCINSKAFQDSKKSGDYFVKEYMNQEFIDTLRSNLVIDNFEAKLLSQCIITESKDLPRGTKSKVKRLLVKKIQPLTKHLDNQAEQSVKQLDLGLPTVNTLVDEVKKEKIPIKINNEAQKLVEHNSIKNEKQNKVHEVPSKLQEKNEESSKPYEEVSKSCKEVSRSVEHHYKIKDVISHNTRTLYNQLRYKLYSRDKIEVFVNQRLSTIVENLDSTSDINLDIIVCDKVTLEVVCVVIIADKITIDSTATILNSLGIQRLVVKEQQDILDSQDIRVIEEIINNRYAPLCEMCGLPMRQKENLRTKRRFYACIDNKNCRHTIDIEN